MAYSSILSSNHIPQFLSSNVVDILKSIILQLEVTAKKEKQKLKSQEKKQFKNQDLDSDDEYGDEEDDSEESSVEDDEDEEAGLIWKEHIKQFVHDDNLDNDSSEDQDIEIEI